MSLTKKYGFVAETQVGSWTGSILYSDFAISHGTIEHTSKLNVWAQSWVYGNLAGIARVALGIIHTVGHLFAYLSTFKWGHLFHIMKGICEILRGAIETIPVVGQIFSRIYSPDFDGTTWWLIKIYNPRAEDKVDIHRHRWCAYPELLYLKDW